MAIVTTDNKHYTGIANAIRDKGVSGDFKPSEMASAIGDIPSGTPLPELNDPATPSDVLAGKEYINGDGEKRVGNFFDVVPYIRCTQSLAANSLFYGQHFPVPELKIDLSGIQSGLPYTFNKSEGLKKLSIKVPNGDKYSYQNAFSAMKDIEKIIFVNALKSQNYAYLFSENTNLKSIEGSIDFTYVNSDTYANRIFNDCTALESVNFAENSLNISFAAYTIRLHICPNLTDESIISVANGVKDILNTGKSKNLWYHATPKARCNQLFGDVHSKCIATTSITDEIVTVDKSTFEVKVSNVGGDYTFFYNGSAWTLDGTTVDISEYGISLERESDATAGDTIVVSFYHFFNRNDESEVSLSEFITNIKGWTLV